MIGAAVADRTHPWPRSSENAAQFSATPTRAGASPENPSATAMRSRSRTPGSAWGRTPSPRRTTESPGPEALDLFDKDRVGLFVVSRLAARHDIKVHSIRPYGGTTAVVPCPPHSCTTGRRNIPPTAVEVPQHEERRVIARARRRSRSGARPRASADRPALTAPYRRRRRPRHPVGHQDPSLAPAPIP